MDEQSARQVAAAWNKALLRVPNRPEPAAAERAWSAIHDALLWLVPDGVEEFAVDEAHETPRLYLLTNKAVFVVELAAEHEQQQRRVSRLRRITLQPATATLELETMVSSGIGSVRMSLMWSFRLDPELTLQLSTLAESDSAVEPNHAFATALAEKLGWSLPELPS
jgi:hypothetical protein